MSREYTAEQKARRREYRRQRYANNPEVRRKQAEYHAANRERINAARRDAYMRKTYGFGADEFDRILEEQGGACKLCGNDSPDRWHADHDHGTGKFRGIICRSCNHGLGFLGDDIEGLERALAYLKGAA